MSPFDARFVIIVFGDDGCGKTSLITRFMTGLFREDIRATIGVDFEVKTITIGSKKVKLQIWDFGKSKKHMLSSYLHGAKGGIFMYDITNYFSLAHIEDWLQLIRKKKRVKEQFPIIMVGGKIDLEKDREVSAEEGMQIAKSKGMDGFIECSSKTGVNVEKAFEALARLMMLSKPLNI